MADHSARVVAVLVSALVMSCCGYLVDDSVGLGRRFDGIGGLSGGGVSMANNDTNTVFSSRGWKGLFAF